MKINHCLFVMFSLFAFSALAQTDYHLIVSEDAYTPLTDTISLTEGEIWDDPYFVAPVGFDFQLFDLTYNSLYSQAAIGGFLSPVQSGGDVPLIIPYGSDLADRGYNGSFSESDICYKLTGEVGARIFKMEWKNVGFYRELLELNTNFNYTNFQLWIYEGSSDIEFRFGQSHIPDFEYIHGESGVLMAISDSIGFAGYGPGQVYHLKGTEAEPELTWILSEDFFDNYNLVSEEPINGRVYRLTTQLTSATHLVKVNARLYPSHGSGQRTLEVDEAQLTPQLQYRIVNMHGQVIEQKRMDSNQMVIQVNSWPSGFYYLTLLDENHVVFNTAFMVN